MADRLAERIAAHLARGAVSAMTADRARSSGWSTARTCRCRPMPPPISAGVDLLAAVAGERDPAARRARELVPTGFAIALPARLSRRRCGRAPAWRCKHGVTVLNTPGHHRCRLSRRDRRHPDQSRQRALRHPPRRAHRAAGGRAGVARGLAGEWRTQRERARRGRLRLHGHARGQRRLRRHGTHRQPVRALCAPSDPRRGRRRGPGQAAASEGAGGRRGRAGCADAALSRRRRRRHHRRHR